MFFSVIIPVFNRPEELRELLESLRNQSFTDFEVLVVEDGSSIDSKEVCEYYASKLSLSYFFQFNTGQGFARNFGMSRAKGDFFVILDSDVILPKDYLQNLWNAIKSRSLDAFGGPDAAGEDFTNLQKAMDFAMTSFWTTGGIRGKLKDVSKYQARGFNMGVSRKVFEEVGGFVDPNRGEDIEWSIRIKKAGYRMELVQDAYVFHKRKNTLFSFAKQAFSFGRNRVNVSRFHPDAIKLVHLLPSGFLLFLLSIPVFGVLGFLIFKLQLVILGAWMLGVFLNSLAKYQSLQVAVLSLITSIIQLMAYGSGLIFEWIKKKITS
ncbi:GT2 family glycosyltransferase [Algoriphagus boseongensis]|uniref:GT2 family glycosyltransferase n=1 Tax=Algoriphagus boseongensis TaxID=1442587 RepID=A0A4R6T590_9BACT|nr:glycosyltransferase [Algoriphagus boseongensis]TDQ14926.1 GT2 family glycosyltransferase [Algoriphagus boseongensis]